MKSPARAHCKKARRRYCFLGASVPLLPDVLPLPEGEGLVEGEVEGLVMLPVLPPVLARVSYAFFAVGAGKRCAPPASVGRAAGGTARAAGRFIALRLNRQGYGKRGRYCYCN